MNKRVPDKSYEWAVGRHLKKMRLTLSVAESCTGGMLSNRITNIAGSSKYFTMAVIAYSNESKISLLDIPKSIIKRYGAVSKETAKYMVEGIKKKAKTDIALSITGIAGPGGGSQRKPIGLVFIGLSAKDNKILIKRYQFKGNRLKIKERATTSALKLLLEFLKNDSV